MPASWQIRLKKADGSLAAIIDRYVAFTITRRVNAPGAYVLRMDGNDEKCSLFELDGQIEFWRRYPEYGIEWYLEFEALHRVWYYHLTNDDKLQFESWGKGYNGLLARRIVEDKAGTAGASKSGAAETVAKAFVNEQCGPGAGSRALSGFSIQADAATGNTVTLDRAFRNVLEVVQYIASIGGGDFAVVGTGAATFQFRWYNGQLGTDRSSTVIFAVERGNMAHPELLIDRSAEITAVLVGGQGEGTARATVWRTAATRIADSTWNRREAFVDAKNESGSALNDKGDARLEEGRPKNQLTFDVVQTPGCLYGKHYFLGDLVKARFVGVEATKKVTEVQITVDEHGEHISVGTEDV